MRFMPNYDCYRKILVDINATGKYCDYIQAQTREEFIVLRHDIEFSIKRAYELSLVEDTENIKSTYFVQLTNNSYNMFSKENLNYLKDMYKRGHHIGLHYHCHGNTNQNDIINGVQKELKIMENILGFSVDRFSMHRPSKESRYWEIEIPNIINAYSHQFFTYSECIKENLEVKYIADSKHRWNYGEPTLLQLIKFKKIQLLIHPFSWTETGYDNENNFKSLLNEKTFELMDTFSNEFQRYEECREVIMNEFHELEINKGGKYVL